MSIWQRIFGSTEPPPDNGDRMVMIPDLLVRCVKEASDDPGEYIREAVRQRLRGVEVANDERSTMELELTNLIARSFEGDERIPFMAIEAAAGLLVEAGWRPTKPYLYFKGPSVLYPEAGR